MERERVGGRERERERERERVGGREGDGGREREREGERKQEYITGIKYQKLSVQ